MAYTVITIIILIASILLVGVVLIQNSKGGGLASGFAAQNQIMGVKKTTDFVEKATWTLVGVVVVLSVLSASFIPKNENIRNSELRYDQTQQASPANANDLVGDGDE